MQLGGAPDPSVDELARKLSRRNALVRVPPQPTAKLRQGVVTRVNYGAHQVDLKLGASDKVIEGVTFMPPYRPLVGHTCWVIVNGPDLLVLGQHLASTVTDL